MKNKKWLIAIFIFWLLLIYIVATIIAQDKILPYAPTFVGAEQLTGEKMPLVLYRLNSFDGVHYRGIAVGGYEMADLTQAFFPLYPLLIRGFTFIRMEAFAASLLISVVSCFLFLFYAFELLGKNFSRPIAQWFVLIMLSAPAGFFLAAGYNESLFLLWLILALSKYKQKKYWQVAIFCALASATRLVGIILPVALIIDYFWHKWTKNRHLRKKDWQNLAILGLGALGLLAYMFYLWQNYHDPLYFMTVQSKFGGGRETSHLILLPQVIYRYVKMFVVGLNWDLKTWAVAQEFAISLIYLAILGWTGWQNWRQKKEAVPWSWWLFSVGAYLVPTLTGNFSSMPRYVLVCLAAPLFLAKFFARHKRFGVVLIGLSVLVMLFNLALFIQGYWVA